MDNLTTSQVVTARGPIRDCFVRPQTVALSVTPVIEIRRAEETALVTVLTMGTPASTQPAVVKMAEYQFRMTWTHVAVFVQKEQVAPPVQ